VLGILMHVFCLAKECFSNIFRRRSIGELIEDSEMTPARGTVS